LKPTYPSELPVERSRLFPPLPAPVLLAVALSFVVPSHAWAAEPKSVVPDFLIGERSTVVAGQAPAMGLIDVSQDRLVNAFSILEIKLKDVEALLARRENVLIVLDLRKHDEDTWSRVCFIGPLSRKVTPSSLTRVEDPGVQPQIRPFFVNDAGLEQSPYVREGDYVLVLFLLDATESHRVESFLRETAASYRPLVSLDLQELYLASVGSLPERYAAHDGDSIRIRFLRASYDFNREVDLKTFLGMEDDERELFRELTRYSAQPTNDVSVGMTRLIQDVGGSEKRAAAWAAVYASMSPEEQQVTRYSVQHRASLADLRISDLVNPGEEIQLAVKKFGYKSNVIPTISFGTFRPDPQASDFNPIKKAPAVGTNIYLTYDGRSQGKKYTNWLPGIHMSLLSIQEDVETEFTLGFVHPVLPSLRSWFGVYLAWHDLQTPVMGVTFSPKINFRTLVGAEETK